MAKTTASKTAKKPAKTAAPKAAAPKPNATKVAAPKAVSKTIKPSAKTISAQDRYHMIDEAAYYRAEKNGFQVDPHANWIAAEREIDELLAKQNIKVG
jgi:hypothetical protein